MVADEKICLRFSRTSNDVTKKYSYPLPHIRDLDKMEGSKYWTTLNATSDYWFMPSVEEDKEKTAFSVPREKFEFNVTPYGLCNAGASYERMIDICLAGLPADRVLTYMDDIVIFRTYFKSGVIISTFTVGRRYLKIFEMYF